MTNRLMIPRIIQCLCVCIVALQSQLPLHADEALAVEARKVLLKSVDFFRKEVAVEGGYVYRYAPDLTLREGENAVGNSTVWIEPPGTPAVGMAYLEAHRLTGETALLDGAKETAASLIRGQLHSGGWADSIDFDPEVRKKSAYRVDGPAQPNAANYSTLDDNKSQSAILFLANLDQALQFNDAKIHEATVYALDALLANQFPNGGWPQRFKGPANPKDYPIKTASYPDSWSRTFPAASYKDFYTLNDNTMIDTLRLMLSASTIYSDDRYRQSAIKGGDFLLLAQMPEPQPAWAQQYNLEMHPAWARKFEPPAISGSESQRIVDTLVLLYQETGDSKYLNAAEKAYNYLAKSVLPSGKLARFYELQTNRPLYFTKEYVLTYDDSDLPTHYAFIANNGLNKLAERIDKVKSLSSKEREAYGARQRLPKKVERPNEKEILPIIKTIDSRGAWVEPGKLSRHQGESAPDKIIRSETFIKNIGTLSRYLATPSK